MAKKRSITHLGTVTGQNLVTGFNENREVFGVLSL